ISTPGQNDDALGRLERRIESIEFATQRENRWWRGGLIAALVLVALSILIAGHHRRPKAIAQMGGMAGWPGGMPYGGYGPYLGLSGPCGPGAQYGWGPGPWSG